MLAIRWRSKCSSYSYMYYMECHSEPLSLYATTGISDICVVSVIFWSCFWFTRGSTFCYFISIALVFAACSLSSTSDWCKRSEGHPSCNPEIIKLFVWIYIYLRDLFLQKYIFQQSKQKFQNCNSGHPKYWMYLQEMFHTEVCCHGPDFQWSYGNRCCRCSSWISWWMGELPVYPEM